jgi:hypothetical protein
VANACIQPTLFRAADAVPRDDVAAGSAVLAMARQVGSLLGVALLVVVLGSSEALSHSGFELVWLLAIGSALLTGAAAAFIPESQQLLPRSTRGRQLVTSH